MGTGHGTFSVAEVVPTYGTLGTAVSLHFTNEAYQSRLLKDAPETVPFRPEPRWTGTEAAPHRASYVI